MASAKAEPATSPTLSAASYPTSSISGSQMLARNAMTGLCGDLFLTQSNGRPGSEGIFGGVPGGLFEGGSAVAAGQSWTSMGATRVA